MFSWDYRLASHASGRYVTLNYVQDFPEGATRGGEPEILPTMISSAKGSANPRSIYSRRVVMARAAEQAPGFNLWGPGWGGFEKLEGDHPARPEAGDARRLPLRDHLRERLLPRLRD